ncbi:MAG: MFS transporter [Conexivisphaera sp.]
MEYKWKVWSVTMVGSLMSAIDSTVVVLAILPIAEDLHTDYITMVWVVVAYLLVNTALVLSLGRMGDLYGRKRMYNAGFAVFIVGSALSGLAPSGLALVIFRGIQGIGAAMLTANSFALISQVFPPNERGRAFGMNAIVWGAGSILGIILGGVIITYTTWRAIFLINVPIGVFGTLWAYRSIRPDAARSSGESFDLVGAGTFTAALLSLLLAFTWGLLYSWSDPYVGAFLAASAIAFAGFLVWEARFCDDPIVDVGLFRNRVFSLSVGVAMLQSLALFAVNFLLMFYFEGIAGVPILTAAYLLLPMSAMSMIVGPFAGRLSDRVGARVVATVGLLIQAAALYMLSRISAATPLAEVAALEAVYGVGGGMFWPANTSAIMSSSPPRRYGVASGVMNMLRNTGMVLSFVLALTAATSVLPAAVVYQLFVGTLSGRLPEAMGAAYLRGQALAFDLSTALLVVSALMSLVRGKRELQMRGAGSPAPGSGIRGAERRGRPATLAREHAAGAPGAPLPGPVLEPGLDRGRWPPLQGQGPNLDEPPPHEVLAGGLDLALVERWAIAGRSHEPPGEHPRRIRSVPIQVHDYQGLQAREAGRVGAAAHASTRVVTHVLVYQDLGPETVGPLVERSGVGQPDRVRR